MHATSVPLGGVNIYEGHQTWRSSASRKSPSRITSQNVTIDGHMSKHSMFADGLCHGSTLRLAIADVRRRNEQSSGNGIEEIEIMVTSILTGARK